MIIPFYRLAKSLSCPFSRSLRKLVVETNLFDNKSPKTMPNEYNGSILLRFFTPLERNIPQQALSVIENARRTLILEELEWIRIVAPCDDACIGKALRRWKEVPPPDLLVSLPGCHPVPPRQ